MTSGETPAARQAAARHAKILQGVATGLWGDIVPRPSEEARTGARLSREAPYSAIQDLALLEWLTHHCDILETGNESWRLKHRACRLPRPKVTWCAGRGRHRPQTAAKGGTFRLQPRGSLVK